VLLIIVLGDIVGHYCLLFARELLKVQQEIVQTYSEREHIQ